MKIKALAAAFAALIVVAVQARAEQFVAAPTREVGPHITGQLDPAPSGNWQASDDRVLGASVVGQQGWTGTCSNQNYDQEIIAGVAHSGGHGWRLSNWYHDGCVNHVISPAYTAVGENGATTIVNHGGVGPATDSIVYEFWFRTANTQADPGTFTSTTITDQAGRRMTYLGFFDEFAGPGGPAGNGCPSDDGCFHLDASGVTDGGVAGDDNSVVFDDNYSPALQRGQWYRVHIDATFNDTIGESTRRNDVVNYVLYDAAGNQVWAAAGINTWEDAYYVGHYGSNPGDKVASSYIAYRISANPDDGTQSQGDTYSVNNRPHGIVFDDLKVTPGNAQPGYATSFDFDRYVATTGTDAGDCSIQATPCRTITYAIAQSNAYDTIHVGPGRYAENSGAGVNLVIDKPVAIEGAQAGVDARTRAAGDNAETILVPAVVDAGLSLGSLADSAVVTVVSDGVSLDGLIIDGDNPNLTSPSVANPINLNGTNPDADTGILASGSGITVQNVVLRNLGGSGMFAFMDSGVGGDNLIQLNRFTNITNPSTWGLGIYAADNFYAQISDNLMDQVRVGMQIENNSSPDSGTQAPAVLRNEIHATRTGIFHNLFYGSATTYTLADNHIVAAANAGQSFQWNGLQIESMQTAQNVIVSGNSIDATALAGSRTRVGYVLNNLVSSAIVTLDGGTVSNVDVGVLATDATNYTGPVNGAVVQNIAFSNIALGAVYVEDTNEIAGSAAVTIGAGNSYAGVLHELVLSGAAPSVSFGNGVTGVDDVLVRSSRSFYFGRADTFGACAVSGNPNSPQCGVANASINAGIAAANAGGTVYLEQGTFDEMGVIGTGKDDLRLTAADQANPPTLTRLSGGPNQPVLVVTGTPLGNQGAAPKGVTVDHLNFAVDKVHAAEGLLANGFVDGMLIDNNHFVQSASASSTVRYAYTNAISVNIDPQHNSLGLTQAHGANVTIQNNVIRGSTAPTATKFRAGIAMDAGVGTLAHNDSEGLNHDAIVRFSTLTPGGTNGVSIIDNNFVGGGLEYDAPNAGISPIVISGNSITAATNSPALALTQQQLEADISVLRLIDNPQAIAVTVSNNVFAGYANGYRGALVENFPNATFSGNTFTPLGNAADFLSLVVSNKEINQNNPAQAPYPMSFTALQNTFNGSGVGNAGRAVEFIDDNDANGTASFGTLAFGDTTAANANSFDANHQLFFNLIGQHCDTNLAAVGATPGGAAPQCSFLDYNDVNAPGGLVNTQVRPFRGNVFAINNLFGGLAPRSMSPLQQAMLNAQTHDINDDTNLGYVNYGFTGEVALRLQGPVDNVQTGVPTNYTATLTNTGNALSENVLVHFSISRTGGIQSGDINVEYFDGSSYQTIPLTACPAGLCGTFGPPSGFPVGAGYDAVTQLRDTFFAADTFTVNATVQGVSSGVVYAADTLSTQVNLPTAPPPPRLNLSLTGPSSIVAGVPTAGYAARLTNTGGATTENVLVNFVVSRSGGFSASSNATLEYDQGGGNYAVIPLTVCGSNLCGSFGPPGSGFPVAASYDATTPLRFTSVRSGAVTVSASVDGVTSGNSYATAALTVNVGPGAATTIAAYPLNATSFSGTAGTPLATTPAVIVTDANGNPVPGVSVTFTADANSGTLTGASQVTDANGIATLGGWTLGTAATETVDATAPVANGSPVVFTASVTAHVGLGITISDGRQFVQYGRTLDYVIVITNAGPSTATNIQIGDNLPPELDGANASWFCFHSDGATCGDHGTGNLSDVGSIPAGGSLTYLLSVTVPNDPNLPSEVIVDTATITSSGGNDSATSTTQIVIFRDGFEPGGDGAESVTADFRAIGSLDDAATLTLDPALAPQSGATPAAWLRVSDAKSRAVFRVDAMHAADNLFVRLVSIDERGSETPGAWTSLAQSTVVALGLTGAAAAHEVMLTTSASDVQAAAPAWIALPLQVFAAQ